MNDDEYWEQKNAEFDDWYSNELEKREDFDDIYSHSQLYINPNLFNFPNQSKKKKKKKKKKNPLNNNFNIKF
jgi:hypothetical protein